MRSPPVRLLLRVLADLVGDLSDQRYPRHARQRDLIDLRRGQLVAVQPPPVVERRVPQFLFTGSGRLDRQPA
jgi:hypothetical protein